MATIRALEDHPAEELARMAFSKLRFWPLPLRDDVRRRGLWEDLAQELYCIALEAWREGKTAKDMGAIGSRGLRRFFKAYGYVRSQSNGHETWLRLEVAASTFELDGHDPWERVLGGKAMPTAVRRRGHPPNYKPRDQDSVTREILERLSAHPEGLTRHQLVMAFRNRVRGGPIAECCARLVTQGMVKEIPRQGKHGSSGRPGPLLVLVCPVE